MQPRLADMTSKQVSFQAVYLGDSQPPAGTPLIVTDVSSNQGNAYSSSTGYFTAPFAGTYCFIGSSGSTSLFSGGSFSLNVDNTIIGIAGLTSSRNHVPVSTVHGVVHMNRGQRAWLSSRGLSYDSSFTTFTGFLLHLDP